MTPEERARANAITDALSASSRERRGVKPRVLELPIPPATTPARPTEKAGNGFRYAALFCFVVALHLAGFLAYQHYSDVQEAKAAKERADLHAQAMAEAEAARALAEAKAQLARSEADRARLLAQQARPAQKIEYNVYEAPKQQPQRNPAPVVQPQREEAQAPEPVKPDRRPDHRAVAHDYLLSKKSGTLQAYAVTTEPVPGWEGRYCTQFEAPQRKSSTSASLSPRRWEVLTEERDGKIVGVDITTKGY